MKILFDQGTPRPLRRYLSEHSIDTAAERGWSRLENGDLLDAAESDGYDILITTDQSIRHQQNLSSRRMAIIVLLSGAWPYALARIEDIQSAVSEARPGELREISIRLRSGG